MGCFSRECLFGTSQIIEEFLKEQCPIRNKYEDSLPGSHAPKKKAADGRGGRLHHVLMTEKSARPSDHLCPTAHHLSL